MAKLKTLSVPGFPHLKNQTGTKEQSKDPKIFFGGERKQMGHKDNLNPLKDRHQKKFRSN